MDEWRGAAEEALSALWGVPVACAIDKPLREQGRSRVFRLAVAGGPVESVILKASLGEEGRPYVVGDPSPDGAFRRLCNEWAGGALLGPLGLGANAYLADTTRGICLLQDLGEGETLAAKLTANDPAAATAALLAYARSLGDMHAATKGQTARWTALLAERGAVAGGAGPLVTPWRLSALAIPAFCRELGVEPPAGLDAEFATVADALDEPGDYLAFTPADCCPDNHFLRGERVVFFDFEGAMMRHALLDAGYFLAPFPTCWCAAALPAGLPERLLAAYRQGFPGGDDFDDQLTMALTSWLTMGVLARQRANWLEADAPWGLSTMRQQVLALIGSLLARPNLVELLPSLAGALTEVDQRLRARWPDLAPMPPYPAFR